MRERNRQERWEPRGAIVRIARHRLIRRRMRRRYRSFSGAPQTKAQAARFQRFRLVSLKERTPIPLTVTEVERLDPTAPEHRTLRITFEGEGGLDAVPNDFLSIRWRNDPATVERALELFGERPERSVRIATASFPLFPGRMVTTTLREALTDHIELQTVSAHLLKRCGFSDVARHNAAEMQRYLAFHKQASGEAPPGADDYVTNFRAASMLSIIERMGANGEAHSARRLLARQDRLFLRPYTMSSFERLNGGRFRASITVSVVEKSLALAGGGSRTATGRATAYLSSVRPGDSTEGLILPDRHLFPQTLGRDVPLIIVCTGAGVAGPLSLLRAGYRGGPLWFIYGVRNRRDHSLYGDELQRFVDGGVISRLDIAESRPTSPDTPRRYVQDVLAASPDEVAAWLRDGAHLFMGGRLSMGVAVNRTVRDLLITTDECAGEEEANARIREWYDTLRFQASVSRV